MIIEWLKEDLEYYEDNIGEVKDYGDTLRGLARPRIMLLEQKEQKELEEA